MNLSKGAAAAAAVLLLCVATAGAAETTSETTSKTPSDVATQVDAALEAGETVKALDLVERYRQAVWDAAPLAFRKTELVAQEPQAFGDDTPRADTIYDEDQEIHIYAEPVAYGRRQEDDGWVADFVADVRIAERDGTIIAAHKGFSEFKVVTPARDDSVFLAISYVFGGLGTGDYVVTTTLHDTISGKVGAFSTDITIR